MNAPAPAQGGAIPPGYRDVRLVGEPLVSLVVVADRELPLARLAAECGGHGVELVALQPGGELDAGAAELEEAYPGVRFVRVAAALSPAALRERGLAAAEGDIVLFARGEEIAEPGWLESRLGRWSTRFTFPLRGGIEPPAALTTSTRSDE